MDDLELETIKKRLRAENARLMRRLEAVTPFDGTRKHNDVFVTVRIGFVPNEGLRPVEVVITAAEGEQLWAKDLRIPFAKIVGEVIDEKQDVWDD